MLYIVYKGTGNIKQGTILFKVDAWEQDCEEQARKFIREHYYIPTRQFITLNGDMIIEVE